MVATHRELLIGVLALSLLAVGTAPSVVGQSDTDDHNESDCRIPDTFEGWLWGANPAGEQLLVSQISYQIVEDGHIGEYVNGVDAYVVDLGCRLAPGQQPRYCIQRIEHDANPGDLYVKFLFSERQDDLAVSHFDSGWGLIDTHNPDGTSDFCDRIPGTTRYVVVWTTEGIPRGVQAMTLSDYLPTDLQRNVDTSLPGPFTLKFCLEVGFLPNGCPPAMD